MIDTTIKSALTFYLLWFISVLCTAFCPQANGAWDTLPLWWQIYFAAPMVVLAIAISGLLLWRIWK